MKLIRSILGAILLLTVNAHSQTVSVPVVNPGVSPTTGTEADQFDRMYPCTGRGINIGNNGTSAQGWAGCGMDRYDFRVGQQGIHQLMGGTFDSVAAGDKAWLYGYMKLYGGFTDASGENDVGINLHLTQRGFLTGNISGGAVAGSTLITAGNLITNGNNDCCDTMGHVFNPGGMALDTQIPGPTVSIMALGNYAGSGPSPDGVATMYYTTSGASLPQSTAWGSLIASSCTAPTGDDYNPATAYSKYQITGPGDGAFYASAEDNNKGNYPTPESTHWVLWQFQNVGSITCDMALGAGSGNFTTASHMYLAGPSQDEVQITAATSKSATVQTITFLTRFAWDSRNGNTDGAAAMQGGLGGTAFISTGTLSTWPIAYQVLGAVGNRLYFSNCAGGQCNGVGSSNIITPAPPLLSVGVLTRAGSIVTMNQTDGNPNLFQLPKNSAFVLSGGGDPSFNGTFTVLFNSMNTIPASEAVITWLQTGADASTSTFNIAGVPPSITLYPMAFVIGINNGQQGTAELGTNNVAWTLGDPVVSTPTSQMKVEAMTLGVGVHTGGDARVLHLYDGGPTPVNYLLGLTNSGVGGEAIEDQTDVVNHWVIGSRPANNGAIIDERGRTPLGGVPGAAYRLFTDGNAFTDITIYPLLARVGVKGDFSAGANGYFGKGLSSLSSTLSLSGGGGVTYEGELSFQQVQVQNYAGVPNSNIGLCNGGWPFTDPDLCASSTVKTQYNTVLIPDVNFFARSFNKVVLTNTGSSSNYLGQDGLYHAVTKLPSRLHKTLFGPPSSSFLCVAGDFSDDANYHYVCVAASKWKRVALVAF